MAEKTNPGKQMWDQRYSAEKYAYGKEPNEFLAEVVPGLPPGRSLCLGAGEGRNVVYLAQKGYKALAVDFSEAGRQKAEKLAEERGVKIEYIISDLAGYSIQPNSFNVITAIFCHVPPVLRRRLHTQVVRGLKQGGVFILEAYTAGQLKYNTGGPKNIDLLMSIEQLKIELAGLQVSHAVEKVRPMREGLFHQGPGAVAQLAATKK